MINLTNSYRLKNGWCILAAILLLIASCTNSKSSEQRATITTNLGQIEILLYNETPLHRDNFIKLVKEKFYEGLLFHRIIPNFVIQGGDPLSKTAQPEDFLGGGGPGYEIKAEIGSPHFRGTLAAARNQNPEKQSSGSQFYIITGASVTEMELNQWESQRGIKYNPAQRAKYLASGGLPSLDTEYTVFGEVVSGMDIVDKISALPTNPANRPVENISMSIKLK